MIKIHIDKEFSELIPGEQNGDLEETILADGRFIDPLVVWKHKNTLLDGHRRYHIHIKHPSLKMPKPVVLDFETRQEAHDWIIYHQISKRSTTDEQKRYLIGKLYSSQRPRQGPRGNSAKLAEFQNTPKNAAEIAKSVGVPERTARRYAAFSEAIDAAKEAAPTVAHAVLSGDIKGTTKDLQALAGASKRDTSKVAKIIADGEAKSVGQAIKISGGTSFDPAVLDRIAGRKRKKSGASVTSGKDRALAKEYLSKLCRIFKRLEIFDEFDASLSQMLKRVKQL
jgi:hypothetical protein